MMCFVDKAMSIKYIDDNIIMKPKSSRTYLTNHTVHIIPLFIYALGGGLNIIEAGVFPVLGCDEE